MKIHSIAEIKNSTFTIVYDRHCELTTKTNYFVYVYVSIKKVESLFQRFYSFLMSMYFLQKQISKEIYKKSFDKENFIYVYIIFYLVNNLLCLSVFLRLYKYLILLECHH